MPSHFTFDLGDFAKQNVKNHDVMWQKYAENICQFVLISTVLCWMIGIALFATTPEYEGTDHVNKAPES